MTSVMNETRAGDGRSHHGEHPPNEGRRERQRSGMMRPETLAKGLGWFSVGLGVAQLVAPRRVARLIGVRPSDRVSNTMRAIGARELASGIGILAQRRRAPWVWARVGGDVLDLALLGRNLVPRRKGRGRLAAATAAVAAVTVLDLLTSEQLASDDSAERPEEGSLNGSPAKRRSIHVLRSITIDRSPEEVYAFWRDFENLPRFMEHLESVQVTGERRSHWKAKAPAGRTVEWDAEMTEDVSGERIAWRSLPGTEVPNRGVVRFLRAPADGGTEVHVDLHYEPPAGRAGAVIAKLFGEEPELQLASDLRRFKQVLETGEVVRSDASIHQKMHPAQPPVGDLAVSLDVEGGY